MFAILFGFGTIAGGIIMRHHRCAVYDGLSTQGVSESLSLKTVSLEPNQYCKVVSVYGWEKDKSNPVYVGVKNIKFPVGGHSYNKIVHYRTMLAHNVPDCKTDDIEILGNYDSNSTHHDFHSLEKKLNKDYGIALSDIPVKSAMLKLDVSDNIPVIHFISETDGKTTKIVYASSDREEVLDRASNNGSTYVITGGIAFIVACGIYSCLE